MPRLPSSLSTSVAAERGKKKGAHAAEPNVPAAYLGTFCGYPRIWGQEGEALVPVRGEGRELGPGKPYTGDLAASLEALQNDREIC